MENCKLQFSGYFIIRHNFLLQRSDRFYKSGNMWALTRENLTLVISNSTGADKPVHPRSLISAFVIHFLESIICKLAIGEISIF